MERRETMCRTVGHSWDEIPWKELSERGVVFALRCVRCTTRRYDVIDRKNGDVVGRRYVYPDGYRRARGTGRPNRSDLRLQLLARKLRRAS